MNLMSSRGVSCGTSDEVPLEKLCMKCQKHAMAPGQHWCNVCRRAWTRARRKRHRDLSPEQRLKANARSFANSAQRRGQLTPQPCERCGNAQAEKHHKDYSKPLEVQWLCRACHRELHKHGAVAEVREESAA